MKIHHTRRVNFDHSFIDNGVTTEDLGIHIEYNITMRSECALFVDGICLKIGSLSKEDCNKISKELKQKPIIMKQITLPYK